MYTWSTFQRYFFLTVIFTNTSDNFVVRSQEGTKEDFENSQDPLEESRARLHPRFDQKPTREFHPLFSHSLIKLFRRFDRFDSMTKQLANRILAKYAENSFYSMYEYASKGIDFTDSIERLKDARFIKIYIASFLDKRYINSLDKTRLGK